MKITVTVKPMTITVPDGMVPDVDNLDWLDWLEDQISTQSVLDYEVEVPE